MEETEGVILSAQLIQGNQVIDSLERTIHFFKETEVAEEDVSAIKTLEDIINDFTESIENYCKEKNVEILDKTKLSFDLTIKLILYLKIEEKKILVDVPVKKLVQDKNKGEKEDEPSEQ